MLTLGQQRQTPGTRRRCRFRQRWATVYGTYPESGRGFASPDYETLGRSSPVGGDRYSSTQDSVLQEALQVSPLLVLPSSHSSPFSDCLTPSPQRGPSLQPGAH